MSDTEDMFGDNSRFTADTRTLSTDSLRGVTVIEGQSPQNYTVRQCVTSKNDLIQT